MEKRALIALGLSFVIFMVFMYFGNMLQKKQAPEAPAPQAVQPEKPAAPQPEAAVSQAPAAPPVRPEVPPAPKPLVQARPARDVVVDTPLYRAVFTEAGGSLKSFQLKKYLQAMPFTSLYKLDLRFFSLDVERYEDPGHAGVKPKELINPAKGQELPLSLSWEGQQVTVPSSLYYKASQTSLTLKEEDTATLQFSAVSPEGLVFTKVLKFRGNSYGFDLAARVVNRTGQPQEGHLDLALTANFAGVDPGGYGSLGFNGSINNSMDDIKVGKLKELKTYSGKIDWAGLDEGYFLTAMVPASAAKGLLTVKEGPANFMTVTVREPENLPTDQEAQAAYTLYFGPKDLSDLKAVNLGLDRVVSFGWFDFLGKPMLYGLKFIDRYFHNYGWSLVILTLLTRIVLFYPNHKAYKSMKEMQKLQPKVAKIREKYKDDKEAMNKELMALYRTFKVNPLGGCLPMALQLPIFIALYNVLGHAIELRHAPFIPTFPLTNIVWLADLSSKDPLLITPLVMGATMVIQQKMTPSPGDPTQAKMMMFLPIIFTFLFLNFASGLVVYWLINNVLSIAQQYVTNKYAT